MKVFKFGGASLKNASAIKNMSNIIKKYAENQKLLIVVSAMGKTTDAFENFLENVWQKNQQAQESLEIIKNYHQNIVFELYEKDEEQKQKIWDKLSHFFVKIEGITKNVELNGNYDRLYDQLIPFGELISSTIVADYLNQQNITCEWLDARKIIKTDSAWREAKVSWNTTIQNIEEKVKPILANKIVLTQGFIANNEQDNLTTTLGREGSDFTGAIFACGLKAKSLTIWKDVSGVLNADPKRIQNAQVYAQLSYWEAAEMTRYGAKVIHQKTIEPLSKYDIPLYVKSFVEPHQLGTCIDKAKAHKMIPSIIFKERQCLVFFKIKGFHFIEDEDLMMMLAKSKELELKINFFQKTNVSCSLCFNHRKYKIQELVNSLTQKFEVRVFENVELITIKNYDEPTVQEVTIDKNVILEQQNAKVFQAVVYK